MTYFKYISIWYELECHVIFTNKCKPTTGTRN